jgi:hypothetical protein
MNSSAAVKVNPFAAAGRSGAAVGLAVGVLEAVEDVDGVPSLVDGGAVSGRPASGLGFEQAARAAVKAAVAIGTTNLLRNVTFVSPP